MVRRIRYGVVRSESAEQFHERKEDYICHQRLAASVAISEQAEYDCSDRPHRQGRGHGPDDGTFGDLELSRESIHQENQHEEVESIEGPAQKAGGNGMPLFRPRKGRRACG